jgi:hypothetical protein
VVGGWTARGFGGYSSRSTACALVWRIFATNGFLALMLHWRIFATRGAAGGAVGLILWKSATLPKTTKPPLWFYKKWQTCQNLQSPSKPLPPTPLILTRRSTDCVYNVSPSRLGLGRNIAFQFTASAPPVFMFFGTSVASLPPSLQHRTVARLNLLFRRCKHALSHNSGFCRCPECVYCRPFRCFCFSFRVVNLGVIVPG